MDPTNLFVQCSGDGCCGASTSERKRQSLCACWTNQSLPSRLFQHRHVSQASTSFKTSLLHLLHWIALIHNISTHAYMAIYTYMIRFQHCLPNIMRRRQGRAWRPSRADDDNRKVVNTGHNTQTRQGFVTFTTFPYSHCSLDPSCAATVDLLTIDCSFHCLHYSLCSPKACRTMPFTPTLFDHLSFT